MASKQDTSAAGRSDPGKISAAAEALRRIAEAVRRQVPRVSFSGHQVIRAVADLIRQAFEQGAFQDGPYAKVGDDIRHWLVGVTNPCKMPDGIVAPLWVQPVWYYVVNGVAPELLRQRTERMKAAVGHAGLSDLAHDVCTVAKLQSKDKDFLKLISEDTSPMPTQAEVLAVADAIDAEANQAEGSGGAGSTPLGGKGGGWNVKTANVEVTRLLRERKNKPKSERTSRTLARAIGCSEGLVRKTPAWKAYQAELKRRKPKKPKAVSLTPAVLAKEGCEDAELERMRNEELEAAIAEQQSDFEVSPLDTTPKKPKSRRPTV